MRSPHKCSRSVKEHSTDTCSLDVRSLNLPESPFRMRAGMLDLITPERDFMAERLSMCEVLPLLRTTKKKKLLFRGWFKSLIQSRLQMCYLLLITRAFAVCLGCYNDGAHCLEESLRYRAGVYDKAFSCLIAQSVSESSTCTPI
jgi:hypothetical protein